jgi:hypothetical protein
MNSTFPKLLKQVMLSAAVVLALGATAAQAQVELRLFPPAPFIATTRPTYHEGRPNYYYGNRWHYREGREWRQYREEPQFLRDQRNRREFGERQRASQRRDAWRYR